MSWRRRPVEELRRITVCFETGAPLEYLVFAENVSAFVAQETKKRRRGAVVAYITEMRTKEPDPKELKVLLWSEPEVIWTSPEEERRKREAEAADLAVEVAALLVEDS